MSWRARHQLATCAAVAAVLVVGCNRKALQPPDATGAGGSISFDGGQDRIVPSTDVAVDLPIHPPAFDALLDLPADVPLFPGVQSFVVTSQLQRDGGIGSFPSGHVFTMVVNGDPLTAIVGAPGEGTLHPLEPLAGGALHIGEALRFGLPGSCPRSSAGVQRPHLRDRRGRGPHGHGPGSGGGRQRRYRLQRRGDDSLTGVADAEPPRLNMTGDPANPSASFPVVSSEPLPPGASVVLRAASGETTELSTGGIAGSFVTCSSSRHKCCAIPPSTVS